MSREHRLDKINLHVSFQKLGRRILYLFIHFPVILGALIYRIMYRKDSRTVVLTTVQLRCEGPARYLMLWKTGSYCPLLARMTPDASAPMVLPEFMFEHPRAKCGFHRPSPLPHETPESSGQEDAILSPKSSEGSSGPLF